jgi:hypothetical protein
MGGVIRIVEPFTIVTTLAGWEQLRSWPLSHKIELPPERE